MVTPYLTFNGNCEKAFNFYAEAFGGGKTLFARLDNDPSNPVMHASISFTKHEGCIMGADVKEPVVISGMAICVVLPSQEVIKQISVKLSEGGTLVQGFLPHPPPHQNDGGAIVLDKFGYTWYLSTQLKQKSAATGYFADVDAEYERLSKLGVQFPTGEPMTFTFGIRNFYVADPEGNLLEIGSTSETQIGSLSYHKGSLFVNSALNSTSNRCEQFFTHMLDKLQLIQLIQLRLIEQRHVWMKPDLGRV